MENDLKGIVVTFDEEFKQVTFTEENKTVTYQIPADVTDIIKIMWLVKPIDEIHGAIIEGYLGFDNGFEDPFQSIKLTNEWLTVEEHEEIIKKINSHIGGH